MALNVIHKIRRDLIGYLRGWILDSVVIDPGGQAVQQLVIIDTGKNRRLVPMRSISSAEGGIVRLRISSEQFLALPLFDETQFVAQADKERDFISGAKEDAHTVYFMQQGEGAASTNLAGDLQLIRGAYVEAKDGTIGTVGAIEIDPDSGKISQLVIFTRKKEELTLPVALIDRVESDTVYLKITRGPPRPLRRRSGGPTFSSWAEP